MRLTFGRELLTAVLAAAAVLLGAEGLDDLGREPSGNAAEAAEPAAPDDDVGNDEEDEDPSDAAGEPARASEEAAATDILSRKGDPLHGFPDTVRAASSSGSPLGPGRGAVRIRGSLWLAWPAAPERRPSPGSDTLPASSPPAPESPPADVRVAFHALDLLDRARERRIGAERVRLVATPQPQTVPGSGTPVHWTADVDLNGVRSGSYRGYLLASGEAGDTAVRSPLPLPVVVWVRDSFGYPLVILILGAGLYFGLSIYRRSKLKDDDTLVKIAEAEEMIVSDPLLAEPDGIAAPFRRELASYLREAVSSTPPTSEGVEKAQQLWVKWQGGRPEWVAGLGTERGEIEELKRYEAADQANGHPASAHLQALLASLTAGYEAAPHTEDPRAADEAGEGSGRWAAGAYRKAAEERATSARRYRAFREELAQARAEAVRIEDPAGRDLLLEELGAAGEAWDRLADPTADAEVAGKLTELREDVRKAREKAGLAGPATPGHDAPPSPAEAAAAPGGFDNPGSAELVPRHFRARMMAARDARRRYSVVLGTVVYAALVLVGLQKTWGDNPTFGADRLADYLAVAAWALGANAAAALALAAFAREWSLPWLGSTSDRPGDGGTSNDDITSEPAETGRLSLYRAPRLRRL